jgi:hypothetical protein
MEIQINNSFFSYGAFIATTIIGIMGVAIIIFAIHNLYREYRPKNQKDEWKVTTAYLTGKNENVMPAFVSRYHIQTASEEYEIEYWVNGQRYVKFLGVVPDKQVGTQVKIMYNIKHPQQIRESMSFEYHKKPGIMEWGMTFIMIAVGIGFLFLSPLSAFLG